MKRGDFQPGSWRADGFLRCVVWGTVPFLHVCAFGRDGGVFVWSLVMHGECDLLAESGRMDFGIMGTAVVCTVVIVTARRRPSMRRGVIPRGRQGHPHNATDGLGRKEARTAASTKPWACLETAGMVE